MGSTLNLDIGILAYSDGISTSAPQQQDVNWERPLLGLQVQAPSSTRSNPPLQPGETRTFFSGTRTLALDATTQFSWTQDALDSTQYFLTWTGGTAPAFRTDRGLALSGSTLSVTAQPNGSVVLAVTSGGGSLAALTTGDQVWIPGQTTGDVAGPFQPANEGLWTVLVGGSAGSATLARPQGSPLGYANQTGVVVTTNVQVQGFSSVGVQPGDSVDISGGATLPSPLIGTFAVEAATAQRLQLRSTAPLPLITGFTPGATGLTVYSSAVNLVYMEVDQACAVQVNGDAGVTERVSPLAGTGVGLYLKSGPMWSLAVQNRSTSVANVKLITVE